MTEFRNAVIKFEESLQPHVFLRILWHYVIKPSALTFSLGFIYLYYFVYCPVKYICIANYLMIEKYGGIPFGIFGFLILVSFVFGIAMIIVLPQWELWNYCYDKLLPLIAKYSRRAAYHLTGGFIPEVRFLIYIAAFLVFANVIAFIRQAIVEAKAAIRSRGNV